MKNITQLVRKYTTYADCDQSSQKFKLIKKKYYLLSYTDRTQGLSSLWTLGNTPRTSNQNSGAAEAFLDED